MLHRRQPPLPGERGARRPRPARDRRARPGGIPALCALAFALANPSCAQADSPEETEGAAPSSSARVVMLGTGTPQAETTRSGPSVAVVVGDRPYLVDFGPGVVRQAARAWERGVAELAPPRLDTAFATHLHSDHTTGLADLALAPWVLGRDAPLTLYGPPGVAKMAAHITSAYAEDIDIRVNPPSFRTPAGARIEAHEIGPGIVLETSDLRVEAFPVDHGVWKHAYGYRFETAGRSIVVSGDARPSESLVEKARGCDVLVHEAYLKSGFDDLDEEQQSYHRVSHTSGVDLGKLAARVQPGLLVVYHTLLFGGTEAQLLREIQRGFDGEVVIANDLDVF